MEKINNTFNLNSVIEKYNLNKADVENALFPHVRYKNMALARVLSGEALLNSQQLIALADLAGILVADLFDFHDWKGTNENGYLVLFCNQYRAKLNYKGTLLSIYDNDNKLISQHIINAATLKLTELIETIENIINQK